MGMGRQAARRLLRARSPHNGLSDSDGRDVAVACARSYREHMREYAQMSPLEVWYARIDSEDFVSLASKTGVAARARKRIAKARAQNGSELDFPKLAEHGRRPHPHSATARR